MALDRLGQRTGEAQGPMIKKGKRDMLISEQFSERTISRMDLALERACVMLPDIFARHAARMFVAERIVECAKVTRRRWMG